MRKLQAVLVIILLLPFMIGATSKASRMNTDRGRSFLVCDAETADGVCDDANGNDIVVLAGEYQELTFYFSQVGSGTTCNVRSASQFATVLDGTDLSLLSSYDILSTDLSSTNQIFTISGTFYYIWVECDIATTSYATVVVQGSVGTPRN